ncbi:hypothetical protein R3P38DRAFT_2787543 [Favolaschia claudopus]|uniref:Uncharacterized protein n=1 Tax=Favolaschia claudopus TaxID=2862362 RepID=A0AAW0AN74_9AGAR
MGRVKHLLSGGFWEESPGKWTQSLHSGSPSPNLMRGPASRLPSRGETPRPSSLRAGTASSCTFSGIGSKYTEVHRGLSPNPSCERPLECSESGVAVQETLQTGAILQRHLGWVPQRKSKYGTIVPLSLKRKPPIEWKDSAAACHSNLAPKEKGWSVGRSLSTMDGDEVSPAVVEKQMQERQETTQDRSLIKHTDDDHFILNMGRPTPLALAFIKKLRARIPRQGPKEDSGETSRNRSSQAKDCTDGRRRSARAEISAKEAEDAVAAGRDPPPAANHDSDSDSDSENVRAGEGHGSCDEEAEWVPQPPRKNKKSTGAGRRPQLSQLRITVKDYMSLRSNHWCKCFGFLTVTVILDGKERAQSKAGIQVGMIST